MLALFYFLLMLRVGRCSEDQTFETKTVLVGENVKLTCSRKNTGSLFWIRLVSGKFPEILGGTSSVDNFYPRITTTRDPGEFNLHIEKTKLNDTGIYICFKTRQTLIFLSRADMTVVESTSGITAVSPSDPVSPTHSVPLQYSVLSDSNNTICPEDYSACLFRCRSDESHPNFNNTQGLSVEEHDKNSEGLSMRNCISSFFKNISSSHAGNCYCAVATCEEKLCGKNSSLGSEAVNKSDSKDKIILSLLSAAFAISLIIIGLLLCLVKTLKEKSCCCSAAVALQTISATESVSHQSEPMDEDSLVYSAPTFTVRKLSKSERRDEKTEEEQSIYTDVRALGLDSDLTT